MNMTMRTVIRTVTLNLQIELVSVHSFQRNGDTDDYRESSQNLSKIVLQTSGDF